MEEEFQRLPEDEHQFNYQILKVDSKSITKRLPNYEDWREIFNMDLTRANLNDEQYKHCERIIEIAIKDISMGERYQRDLSPILNQLVGLLHGKAGLSRGKEMAAIRAAKTYTQQLVKTSDERYLTKQEEQKPSGLRERLLGKKDSKTQFGGEQQ